MQLSAPPGGGGGGGGGGGVGGGGFHFIEVYVGSVGHGDLES